MPKIAWVKSLQYFDKCTVHWEEDFCAYERQSKGNLCFLGSLEDKSASLAAAMHCGLLSLLSVIRSSSLLDFSLLDEAKWGLWEMLSNSWETDTKFWISLQALAFCSCAGNSSPWLHVFAVFWHVHWNMTNIQPNNGMEKCTVYCQCIFFFRTVRVI